MRYRGRYHHLVKDGPSLDKTLALLTLRWPGIKHVCDPSGFPFGSTELNFHLLGTQDRKIIFLTRANSLRRAVSHWLSLNTHFWIGPKANFERTIAQTRLPSIEEGEIRKMIEKDLQFAIQCRQELSDRKPASEVLELTYEDLFASTGGITDALREVFKFLNLTPPKETSFWEQVSKLVDPEENQFASHELYRSIPGAEALSEKMSQCGFGSLFTE